MSEGLTFDTLREANLARLPVFKNRHGQQAHLLADGSDWSPAQWLQAVMGELGEYANLRKKFERGDISTREFAKEAADELADVVTYLDILAFQLGVDLGKATMDKWNRVSERVGANIYIDGFGVRRCPSEPPDEAASPVGHRLLDLVADALFRAVDEDSFEYVKFLESLGFRVALVYAEDAGETDSDGVWHPPEPPGGYVLAWEWSNHDSDGCFFVTPQSDLARLLLCVSSCSNERDSQ